jgi:hypothetical protein
LGQATLKSSSFETLNTNLKSVLHGRFDEELVVNAIMSCYTVQLEKAGVFENAASTVFPHQQVYEISLVVGRHTVKINIIDMIYGQKLAACQASEKMQEGKDSHCPSWILKRRSAKLQE